MRIKKKQLIRVGSVAAAIALIGCAAAHQIATQYGGKNADLFNGGITALEGFTPVDKVTASKYGKSMAIAVTNEYKVSDNQKQQIYVNYIGQTLAAASAHPNDHYLFGVLDKADEVEAFSGPDGYIFITSGALNKAQDEAEVAGILAHEMTHVQKQHGIQAVQRGKVQQGLMQGASHFANASAGIQQALPWADDLVTNQLHGHYDQPSELEADKGAVDLLIAAGYDPNSLLNFMNRIGQEQQSNPSSNVMSTHPDMKSRAAAVESQIKAAGVTGGATLADRFKANVFAVATPAPAAAQPTTAK
jgi:predicted Zn-dependent protease